MSEHKFSNHLIHETSPYLLQHAHNPVEWYAWNEEALNRAKLEDKPILVSIGYSACHWCHVMAHESFEDESTAQIMNEHFINIKIDREEHPEIDHIYMDAVQLMTGAGGWPLNVFLTPELKPFYGGTYFPPGRAYNRPSWKEILTAVSESFRERKDEVEEYADKLVEYLHNGSKILQSDEKPILTEGGQSMREAFQHLSEQFDLTYGGFGGAPKFPSTFSIRFLLQYDHFYQSPPALDQALLSIDKMIEGGIYDQLGGGLARYSTDAKWLVPHFEKMLYDNALLLEVLAEAFQITKNETYEKKMRETIGFVFRELSDDGKSFYAALDADSEREEGKFYVWSLDEVQTILGDEAGIFCARYDVSEEGNWEGKNILHEQVSIEDLQLRFQLSKEKIEQSLSESRQKLFEAREKRIHPSRDDKKILSWNALMIAALCKCSQALGDESLMQKTVSAMEHLLDSFSIKKETAEWYHHSAKGKFSGKALFDDYACLIRACILIYEITFDENWLHEAKKLTAFVFENFSGDQDALFFMTPKNEANIIARPKDFYDGALPSGNAVMAENLMKLGIIFDDKDFTARRESMMQSIAGHALKFPTSFSYWLMVMGWIVNGSEELVVVGKDFQPAVKEIGRSYIPNKIIMASENVNSNFPLLENKEEMNGKLTFYRCKNYACLRPTNNLTEFLKPFMAE